MKKIRIALFVLLGLLLGSTQGMMAQANISSGKKGKTVVYKIAKDHNQTLDQATCENIDKIFMGKKGILSAKTNPAKAETTVEMEPSVPEADLKAIFSIYNLEIKTITVIDNSK